MGVTMEIILIYWNNKECYDEIEQYFGEIYSLADDYMVLDVKKSDIPFLQMVKGIEVIQNAMQ